MSYIRQGDIMIRSVDLGQLASGSRLGSNINHYDSMDGSVSDSGGHYETLERLRNNTGCCSGQQNQRSDTNTSQKTYTRYIRPCGNYPNLNGNNNSVTKTTDERIPEQLRTIPKRSVRYRYRKRNIILSFVVGLVIGLIISCVFWLTVDRLRESKIVCEFIERTKDEMEDGKDDGTKTATSVQMTQTTSHSRGTTSDKLGKSTSFSPKLTETTLSTPVPKTTKSKRTTLNVSNTKLSTASQKSTSQTSTSQTPSSQTPSSQTLSSRTTFTNQTPTLSTIMIKHTTTSQTSTVPTQSNAETTVTDSTSVVSTSTTKTSTTRIFPVFPLIPETETTRFPSTSRNLIKTSMRTSAEAENTTHVQTGHGLTTLFKYINTSLRPSFLTSSISDTPSTQQTTHHSTEFNSSHNNTSKETFSTVSESSAVHSSTQEANVGSSSSASGLPTSAMTSTSTSSSTMTASRPQTGLTSTTEQPEPDNVDKRSVQGGYVYIRWGSLSCPVQADLMYKGYAAGGHWQHKGGATNTICLPDVPTWGNYSDKRDEDRNLVYGTEYGSTDASFSATTGKKLRYKDVPCSVCQATGRFSHVMIPGRTECFPGWTQEYTGYLMGSGYVQNHASELICVDSSPDYIPGSETVKGGNFLYFAEVRTGSLSPPSYVNGRELACVVCTM